MHNWLKSIVALTCFVIPVSAQSNLPIGIYGHARTDYFPAAASVLVNCTYNGSGNLQVKAQLNVNHDFYIPAAFLKPITTTALCSVSFLNSSGINLGNDANHVLYNQNAQ